MNRRMRVLLFAGISIVAAIAIRTWNSQAAIRAVEFSSGPLSRIELAAGFHIVSDPQSPRSVVVRSADGVEAQVLIVVTKEAGLENGPLSENYIRQIRIKSPVLRENVDMNGFGWDVTIGKEPFPELQAICYTDEHTIGVLGKGEWSRESAISLLRGLYRRTRTKTLESASQSH